MASDITIHIISNRTGFETHLIDEVHDDKPIYFYQ
ncbi:hypothetical protein COLO4_32696 [Corchorus olitorius]|uniref:Uncharacterized protein n=1 Tax=Corchorus olitorius TaxID=93759 RepID=A0A1R3GYJ5_9ROSI|nr:hypothetical protein COLO4_32696 [Corchorus olitorius]